jgi:Protein of unknown function (DUF732)
MWRAGMLNADISRRLLPPATRLTSHMITKVLVAAAGLSAIALAGAPSAHADQVAYLVNVHVRPGYNFPNAEAALGYGYSVCDRVAAKMGYAQLVDEVKRDFNTADYYQGGYLINQAVNELCPAQIWQLRQSAAGYTLPA